MKKAKKRLDQAEAISPILMTVGGYFAYLLNEGNYIALGAIMLSCVGVGWTLGKLLPKKNNRHRP